MIRLQNLDRRPFAFNLYHSEVCLRNGQCLCRSVEVPLPGGVIGSRLEPKTVRVGGFRSAEGNISEPVPDVVEFLGPVATRLREGTLKKLSGGGYVPVEIVKPSV